jgi:hypothetical protein
MTQQPETYFIGAYTKAEAKRLFRQYAVKLHEDQGGTQAAFLALQTAYREHCDNVELWDRHCEVLALSLAHDRYAEKTPVQKINDTIHNVQSTVQSTLSGVRDVIQSVEPFIEPAKKIGAMLYDIFHDPHEPDPDAKAD